MPADPPPRPTKTPAPEYRPTRDYEVTDGSMRTMALAAVGIAVVVMGGVFVLSRHHPAPHGVPVIEPEPTPLRIKPADPGGMKVPGAEDAMPDEAAGVEADKLAPPPEAPAPQALQAQTKASPSLAPPLATSPRITAPMLAAPSGPPLIARPPAAKPLPIPAAPTLGAPLTPARPPPAPPLPVPEPRAEPRAGAVTIQLAALESQEAAAAEWTRLARKLPALAGYRPQITRTERDGKTFFRLRVGGFADIAAATAFCARLHAVGAPCTLGSWR